MTRNYTWFRLATILLVTFVLMAVGCNAEEDMSLPLPTLTVHLMEIRCLIRSWRIDLYDLQAQLVFQMDVELLDSASRNPEPPFLFVSEVVDTSPKIHTFYIVNSQNPGRGSMYPLLNFPTAQPSFRINIHDSNGEIVLTYDTQEGIDALSEVGHMLENGIYFFQVWAKIMNSEWILTATHKCFVVLR